MSIAPLPDQCCNLSIAGIVVALHCASPALAASLRQRYAAFAAHSAEDDVALRIALGPLAPAHEPLPPTDEAILRGPSAQLAGPGYRGWVDLDQRLARFELVPVAAAAAIEYLLRVAYALLGFTAGGLLLHAAGVARHGRAYLFLGPSGTGKTTVARNSPGALVLNDDLVLAMPSAEGWAIHATPFSNPSQVPPAGPLAAPLAAIFRLVQSQHVFLEPLSQARGLAELLAQVPLLTLNPASGPQLLGRARAILAAAPMQRLHFLPDASLWDTIVC